MSGLTRTRGALTSRAWPVIATLVPLYLWICAWASVEIGYWITLMLAFHRRRCGAVLCSS